MGKTATEPNNSGSKGSSNRCGDQVHRLLNLAATLARTAGTGTAAYGRPLGMDAGSLSDAQCLQWAQDVEALLRWGQALAAQAAGEIGHRAASGRFVETGATGAVALLVQTLQLSGREAKQRIDLARQIMPVPDSISGQVAPAAHPMLGQAFFAGQLSQERALTTVKFLNDAQRLMTNGIIGQGTLNEVEESLTATAAEEGPDFIRAVGNQIMSHIDPDGNKPTEADLRAKQGLFFRRARNGLVGIYGHCTIEQYEQIMATISYATNPNKHKDVNDVNADQTASDDEFGTGRAAESSAAVGWSAAASGPSPGNGRPQQAPQQAPQPLWEQLKGTSDLLNNTEPHSDSGHAPDSESDPDNDPDSDNDHDRDSATAQPAQNPATSPSCAPHSTPADGPDSRIGTGPEAEPKISQKLAPNSQREPAEESQRVPAEESQRVPAEESQRVPAEESLQGWGKGWKRRLESWEVPPRPPDAPENAIAPIYEGDAWFWFGSDTPPPWPSNTPEPASIHSTTDGSLGSFGSTSTDSTTEGTTGSSRIRGGFGPGWAGGLLGSPLPSEAEECESWPRLINGIWVPAPGSETDMEGLDSTDPSSTDRAVEDTRTRGQKLLDGLIDCVKLAARTGSLPLNGGLRTQLILTTSEADLRRQDGLGTVYTAFSGPMPLGLFDQSLCDPEVTRMVYGDGAEIINAGRTQRLFTPPQRKLLFARDLGCSFPACTAVAIWCEAHHIIPWQQGGNTDISNACLLCSRHHSLIHNSGWEVELIDGTPWFTPPLQADRMRAPRRNLFHHGLTKSGKPYQPPMA